MWLILKVFPQLQITVVVFLGSLYTLNVLHYRFTSSSIKETGWQSPGTLPFVPCKLPESFLYAQRNSLLRDSMRRWYVTTGLWNCRCDRRMKSRLFLIFFFFFFFFRYFWDVAYGPLNAECVSPVGCLSKFHGSLVRIICGKIKKTILYN